MLSTAIREFPRSAGRRAALGRLSAFLGHDDPRESAGTIAGARGYATNTWSGQALRAADWTGSAITRSVGTVPFSAPIPALAEPTRLSGFYTTAQATLAARVSEVGNRRFRSTETGVGLK
jgi:hypothetical protein